MCHHSYDRLIDLAQRTGDRLIVHDPIEGRDIVIMDVNEYEKIIDGVDRRKDGFKSKNCRDVRSMSSDQMLDQINRDIAIWRAEKEAEEEWEKDLALEDEFATEPPFDPFSEQDYHPAEWHNNPEDWTRKPDPWHSAGSVLDDRYSSFSNDDFDGLDDEGDLEDEDEDEEGDFDFNIGDLSKKNSFDWTGDSDLVGGDHDKIKIEDIPFESDFNFEEDELGDRLKDIPLSGVDGSRDSWKEEPLSDEDPVFYEEPV